MKISKVTRAGNLLIFLLLGLLGTVGCQVDLVGSANAGQDTAAPAQAAPVLIIDTDSRLPDTYPHAPYQFRFHARGSGMVLHWRLEKGAVPPGMKLQDDGFLFGQAEHTGEFQFTVSVNDGKPEEGVQKEFILRVISALTVDWKTQAHVSGSRIEGSVAVSNTTPDDMDLTFIVVAVPPNGRAVAIGYQHFALKRGTTGMELPFGESLPHGGYVVRVDAVGEVIPRRLIYRESLQTPGALQVTVGP